jgi:predicted  nucleic acid-binding Zn-ribbon protein
MKYSMPLWCIVLLLALFAAGLIGTGWRGYNLYIKYNTQKNDFNTLQIKYENQRFELEECKKAKGAAEQSAKDKGEKIIQLEQQNKKHQKEKKDLEKQLADARQNADESLKKNNEQLNRDNQQLQKRLNKVENFIQEWKKDSEEVPAESLGG